MIFTIQYPLKLFWLEEQIGVYDKEPLSCNGYIDQNIS